MNFGFFKNFKTGPLKVKILFPLIVCAFFCVAGIILFSRYFYSKHLLNSAITRGQQLAHSLGTCVQIVHYPYELQRIVYAFASEQHIRFIAVLGGTPLRVLACNRNALKNKPWQHRNLPEGIRLPNFPQEQDAYDLLPERFLFNYALAFHVAPNSCITGDPVYIVMQISTYSWQKELLQQNFIVFIFSLFILIALIVVSVTQINFWILKPLQAIQRQMNKRRLGNVFAMAPVLYKDEIGDLSNTLNEMIRSQEKTENLFQKIVDIAPILMWTTNETNSHFYFNQRWCEFTGQKYLSYTDWSWLKFLHPSTARHYQKAFLEAQKMRKATVFECRIKGVNGDSRWMLCQSVPRILSDGHFEGYISCLVDITERKENEKRLANYAEKLAKARDAALKTMHDKTAFLATISHELRTPINGISGFTHLLKETPLNAEQSDYVNTIASSTQLLLDLINQVLDLSKIEANKLTLEPINFHLDSCIREVCTLFQPSLQKKNLTLSVWQHPQLESWLVGDPQRLRQILMNLLSNAIKFTAEGTIFLRLTGRWISESDYQLFVSVKDQGCGIPKEDQERIFEAFEQVAYQNKGGTGLGLSITQSLIHLMGGGKLKLYSKPQQGSIFYFSIRLKRGTPQALPKTEVVGSIVPMAVPTTNTIVAKVLLVEDNRENQKVAQRILEKKGFDVTIAENGVQCLDWLQTHFVDIIIMDINMPEMDGFEATQHIRSGECGLDKAGIPILGLTARALQDTYDQAIAIGMNALLTKPFEPQGLLNKIYELINK